MRCSGLHHDPFRKLAVRTLRYCGNPNAKGFQHPNGRAIATRREVLRRSAFAQSSGIHIFPLRPCRAYGLDSRDARTFVELRETQRGLASRAQRCHGAVETQSTHALARTWARLGSPRRSSQGLGEAMRSFYREDHSRDTRVLGLRKPDLPYKAT
jgi:hypothetical protein